MPPLFKINLKRNVGVKEDARIIYYLSDGTLTEPKYFDALFNFTSFVDNRSIRLIKCEKTGSDEGVSNVLGLISLAQKYIKSIPGFRPGFDKILLIFDLDVYIDSIDEIISVIKKNNDIIFAFSNPAFELFLLMSFEPDSIAKLTNDEKKDILLNNYIGKDRFICHLLKNKYNFDSKKQDSNFLQLANSFSNAVNQIKDINIYINRAKTELTSNVAYILNVIQNNKFDDIVYFE